MKNPIKFKHVTYLFLVFIAVLFLQSCAIYYPYAQQAVTVPDILQMSKDGMSSKDIIKKMRKSKSVYTLKADQLAKLRDEGVTDSVINYMEKTHINAIRQRQLYSDSYYWGPGMGMGLYGGFGFGWPYGYGYWGWPYNYGGYNLGPAIIYEGRNEFHNRGGHGGRGR